MGRARRHKKGKNNQKIKSFLVFIILISLVFFLAVCSVQRYKETDTTEMTTLPNVDSNAKKDSSPHAVHTGTKEDSEDKATALVNYLAALTALPEFRSVNFTSGQKGELVTHSAITLSYNEEHEQAHWVSYKLTSAMLKGNEKRTDKFKEDPKVSTKSASPTDYRLSGYDRGHLAPAGDFTYDVTAMAESFYMSNMSPQTPSFNRGIWKKLEDQVRYWAKDNEEIYIITGPVITKKEITLGTNKVTVPEYFYKVILDIHPPEYKAIAFLMKNEKSSRPLLDYAITVDSLERFTELDFFPMLPDTLEIRLQNMKNHEIWFE